MRHPIEEKLKYDFKNKQLLKNSLIHSSYANEHQNENIKNNERLEFLGDSVINLIISDHIFKKNPDDNEGDLSKIRASIVCEPALAYISRNLNLGKYIYLGKGEELSGGRDRESILADGFEALIGAIYLDSNLDTVRKIILNKFEDQVIENCNIDPLLRDYKTELQENIQLCKNTNIEYKIYKEEGPDHDKTFYTKVYLNGKELGKGKGKNKKESEQMAAKFALEGL